MNRITHFLPCSIICHGECECVIAKQIQIKKRRDLNVIGDKNGKKCIEINSINSFLIHNFPTKQAFIRANKECLCVDKKTKRIINHKIISIMDKDQTSEAIFESYTNGKLFAEFWYGEEELMLPLYFNPDLDTIFNKHGFKIDTRKHKPAQYFKYMTTQYSKVEEMLKSLNEAESNIRLLFEYLEKII